MEYSGGMKQLLPMLLLVFSLGAGAYDEDDLKKLKTNKDCIKCDLRGAYLAGEKLSYANLSFADLTDATLDSAALNYKEHGAKSTPLILSSQGDRDIFE